jgi:hypothetical protein
MSTFRPGPLSADDAARLTELARELGAWRRLSVSPPLSLRRVAGIPLLSVRPTAADPSATARRPLGPPCNVRGTYGGFMGVAQLWYDPSTGVAECIVSTDCDPCDPVAEDPPAGGGDGAEAFAALLDLLGVTPQQLEARIALRRETTPPTPGAPDPAGVVMSATTRFGGGIVLASIAGYISAGAGDPIGGG